MPFSVRVKGKVHEPKPTNYEPTDVPTEPFPYDSKEHADALAWTSYIAMAVARQEAIKLYVEYEQLGKEIDERTNHPKVGSALKKLAGIEKKINNKQIEYLKHERVANYVWRTLGVRDRQQTGIAFWFNTPAEHPSLYGSWYTHFEACAAPHRKFHIGEVPLLVVPPEQKREYLRVRMGGDCHEPTEVD